MRFALQKFILNQLRQHNIMSLATQRALALLARRFPDMKKLTEKDLALTAFVKVTPKVISVLDYSKGFGHTDLVRP